MDLWQVAIRAIVSANRSFKENQVIGQGMQISRATTTNVQLKDLARHITFNTAIKS